MNNELIIKMLVLPDENLNHNQRVEMIDRVHAACIVCLSAANYNADRR